jgi:hypothetical protein
MNAFGLSFHHFGLAVRKPELAVRLAEGLGYTLGARIFDPEQNVNLMMATHDRMPEIEVIFPAAKGQGPVDSILAKRPDGIIYHLCFATDDLGQSLAALEASGLRVLEISPPKTAILFPGKAVSFYMVQGIGLIEIVAASPA